MPRTINETSEWLSLLPILMQKSFWWWQCSVRYSLPQGISVPASTSLETTWRQTSLTKLRKCGCSVSRVHVYGTIKGKVSENNDNTVWQEGWSLVRVVYHQGGLSLGWSITKVVSHQGGLSSGWSLIRVVYHQGGLSPGWSIIRVVCHQGGLSSGQGDLSSVWSIIRVVCHQGWSIIRVVCHQGWSFVRVVYH